MKLANAWEWSILKAPVILALQVSCKLYLCMYLFIYFPRHREFLFSFCVNRRFFHNSVWNPRYSCSLYSCLGRDLGWKVKLRKSVSHLSAKSTLQQDAEKWVILNKGLLETKMPPPSTLTHCLSLWSVIGKPLTFLTSANVEKKQVVSPIEGGENWPNFPLPHVRKQHDFFFFKLCLLLLVFSQARPA